MMNPEEFYDYIMKYFNLDGTSCRLIKNIIYYVDSQRFIDQKDNHAHLHALLDGAFGLERKEIKKCHFS